MSGEPPDRMNPVEEHELPKDDLLVRLVDHAERSESALIVEGDRDGLPFLMLLVAGAHVGIVKTLLAGSGLKIKRIEPPTSGE